MINARLFASTFCFCVSAMANEWHKDIEYRIGDQVSHQDSSYIATMWNQGNSPSHSRSHWRGWVKIESVIDPFVFGLDYPSGSVVDLNGELYLSKWENRNENPDASWYWRRLGEDRFIDVRNHASADSGAEPMTSAVAILGSDANRNGIKDSFEIQVMEVYQNQALQRLALNASYTYRALHQLELDESINLHEGDVLELFESLYFLDNCTAKLMPPSRQQTPIPQPKIAYLDSLEAALYFRFGQNEAMQDLNGEFDLLSEAITNPDCDIYELN